MAEKLRIISGRFRGRVIQAPASFPARPTTDFARTGLFNVLSSRIDFDQPVLDLFSGLGSVGFECVSRGATELWSVDTHAPSLAFQTKLAADLDFAAFFSFVKPVEQFLLTFPVKEFGFIFADPPYGWENTGMIPEWISKLGWLASAGYLVVEHDGTVLWSQSFKPSFSRKYGKVHFAFFSFDQSDF